MKKIHLIMSFVLSLGVLAACGSGANEAEGEGSAAGSGDQEEITVYTSMESDELPDYIDKFNEEYPDIKVNLVRDSTGVTTAKLIAEKEDPIADVIFGVAATSILVLEQHDLLEGYNPEGIERLDSKFKDEENDPALWTGDDAYVAAIAVNTAELDALGLPVPESYEDLLDPQYKDMIVLSNPASAGTGYLTVTSFLQFTNEDDGWDYMDSLHKNVNQYVHSGSKPAKDVARGEFPIGLTFAYPVVQEIVKGAPVELVLPKEGSGWEIEANALVKKPEMKEAAKTFLDWAISDAALEEYQKNHGVIGADIGTEAPEGYPENMIDQMIDNDLSWAGKNRESILDEWIDRYDGKSAPEDEE